MPSLLSGQGPVLRRVGTRHSDMNHELRKFTLESQSDGLCIAAACIAPEKPIAAVQLVHGMCEHKERYYPLMDFLASKGFACVIHDHRGHGESIKDRDDLGYFYKGGYRAAVEDVRLVTMWAKKEFPGLELFLFGHSMGSLIVRTYTKSYDSLISGLIVCGSPSDNPAAGAGKVLAGICALFGGGRCRPALIQKIAFGSYNKAFPDASSANSWICSDDEVVRAYDADPLCNFRFTANGFGNLFSLVQQTYSRKGWKVANPQLPVYFIAGEEDPCITTREKFDAAVDFMRKVGYADVKSKLYPGMRHEIHNEREKALVWQDIAEILCSFLKR